MLHARAATWLVLALAVLHCALPTAFGDEKGEKAAAKSDKSLAEAQRLLSRGNYAEAEDAFAALAKEHSVVATVGRSRGQAAQGKREDAVKTLTALLGKHTDDAALHAELAVLALDLGHWDDAGKHSAAALKLDPDQLAARFVTAQLHRRAGRLKEALAGYEWFVEYYNQQSKLADAEKLLWICRAYAEYVRWEAASDEYPRLVNKFYPKILKADADCWPAHLERGRLLAEKFNEPDAREEYQAALAINPQAAEVHAALAELSLQNFDLAAGKKSLDAALAANPELVRAQQLLADFHLYNFDYPAARETLEKAWRLRPGDCETGGRLAAIAIVTRQGKTDLEPAARADQFARTIDVKQPSVGEYYLAVADTLDLLRQYPLAAEYYRLALERAPHLHVATGRLGLLQMRLADEATAGRLLRKSFKADPYNVRVKNSLEVLDVLAGYATLTTEHFIIRFDRGQDETLAQYAAEFLEEQVYPQVCERLGYQPKERTLLEIFNRAKSTSGHGWFSARMVGLPAIGAVGACAGKALAITSPNSLPKPFNWSRVLRHEFVHVVNLQQTNFNIPHWFTEALAVDNEGYSPPREWNKLLNSRLRSDRLLDLGTINLAFVRPKDPAQWQLAYCQAWHYLRYLQRLAPGVERVLLTSLAENPDFSHALRRATGKSVEEIERGYLEYLKRYLADEHGYLAEVSLDEDERKALATESAAKPDDAELAGQLALMLYNDRQFAEAGTAAERALQLDARQQQAVYVKARSLARDKKNAEAIVVLEKAMPDKNPRADNLLLLALLHGEVKADDKALAVIERGQKQWPQDIRWSQLASQSYLTLDDKPKLTAALTRLAEADADDAVLRKKLARLTFDASQHADAVRWARELVYADAQDLEGHRLWAAAAAATGDHTRAIRQYQTLARLEPREANWPYALAQQQVAAGQPDKARETLTALLKKHPDHSDAKRLLESLPLDSQ